jgi:hypothetical protein
MYVINDLLLTDEMNNKTRKEFLNKNKVQLERIEWLVTSLLKMSRLDSGSVILNHHKVVAKDVQRVKESKSEKTIALRKLMRLAGLNENMCQHHLDEMDDDYDDMRDNVYKTPLDENDEDYEDDDESGEEQGYYDHGDFMDDVSETLESMLLEKFPNVEIYSEDKFVLNIESNYEEIADCARDILMKTLAYMKTL